jgi:hypothetical protein
MRNTSDLHKKIYPKSLRKEIFRSNMVMGVDNIKIGYIDVNGIKLTKFKVL